MHRKMWLSVIVLLLVAGMFLGSAVLFHHKNTAVHRTAKPASTAATEPNAAGYDKTAYSLTNPASQWVIVNKLRPLQPQTYVPNDLVTPNVPLRVAGNESMQIRALVQPALEAMFADAKLADAPLMLSSGYRSYSYQVSLYGSYVTSHGANAADTFSARPGYSEHQTGLAFDVEPLDGTCDVEQCFAATPAGRWIAANAYHYGFLLRYPADKTLVTGYEYEPWHLRYVGKPLAAELHKQHIETLEEFFDVPAAPDYASK